MENLGQVREELKKDPNNPWALKLVGRYYLSEGHYKLARNFYHQAATLLPRILPQIRLDYEKEIERNPDKIGPRLSLAGFELMQGEIEPVILELEEALEINPRNVEVYNVLGKIFIKQEKIDEVILLLEKSIREGIKDVSLTEILAGAYLGKGRLQDAIKLYNEILEYKPGDKQTLRILGELYTRIEEYNQAALSYQAMFSDDPELSREVVQRLEDLLKKVEGTVFIREILAEIYMRSLKPEAAVAKLREILRLDATKLEMVVSELKKILKSYPGHPQATLALAEALSRSGSYSEAVETYYNLVKTKPEFMDEAIQGYREVLEFCPKQVLARTYLAEAFLYKKQINEALSEFENMVSIDPSSAETVIQKCREIIKSYPQLLLAHLVLGRAYLARGDLQRAVNEAEGIVAFDKKYTAAYLLLGEAYFLLKLCRKAVGVLQTALSIEPYNLLVLEKYRETREKELDREIDSVKEKIDQDPWRISLHLDLAKLYIQKGYQEESIRELQIALKDQARAPFACNLMGTLYRREGRYDLAAAQFNHAIELAPPELSDFVRTVRFNLGSTCEAQGDMHKALKIYEAILQEDIDFGNLKKRIGYLKATSLRSLRDKMLLLVISNYNRKEIIAVWGREGKMGRGGRRNEVSVSFGQNYNTSGFEYFMKGMYKAAQEEFILAVQLDANFAAGINNLGISLAKEGRLSEARNRLEDAVQTDPNSVVLRNNLGVIYFLLGQADQARREFEMAYEYDPDLAALCINLGDLFYLKKDVEKAIGLYKKVGSFDVLGDIAEQRLLYKVP